jgi:hypothetical protein
VIYVLAATEPAAVPVEAVLLLALEIIEGRLAPEPLVRPVQGPVAVQSGPINCDMSFFPVPSSFGLLPEGQWHCARW